MLKYSEEELKQFEVLKFNTNYLININTGEITHAKRHCKISVHSKNGYIKTTIEAVPYYNHRLVWSQVHGNIQQGFEIDHLNKIRIDNRIDNLRAIPLCENRKNRVRNPTNKSTKKKAIKAYEIINNEKIYIGEYPSFMKAATELKINSGAISQIISENCSYNKTTSKITGKNYTFELVD